MMIISAIRVDWPKNRLVEPKHPSKSLTLANASASGNVDRGTAKLVLLRVLESLFAVHIEHR
jgi:hypothetical protein